MVVTKRLPGLSISMLLGICWICLPVEFGLAKVSASEALRMMSVGAPMIFEPRRPQKLVAS